MSTISSQQYLLTIKNPTDRPACIFRENWTTGPVMERQTACPAAPDSLFGSAKLSGSSSSSFFGQPARPHSPKPLSRQSTIFFENAYIVEVCPRLGWTDRKQPKSFDRYLLYFSSILHSQLYSLFIAPWTQSWESKHPRTW